MIHNLKPYPAYKDSGLPWLGEVPENWCVLRGKNVFKVIDVRSETGAEELLTVSSSDGVVPRSQKTVTMFKAESYVGHKLCWPGDLVINSLWAWMQGLGFTKYHGLISSAYSVYRPKPEFSEYADYFHDLLRSAAYKWELQTRSKGVWLSRLQLSDQAFLDMPILVSPKEEQSAIVRYLDHIDRRIRRYIRAKQKLIKLLEEQKQAIILQAVTRGLDPNVKLKPSGVEWLGEVPKHWEVETLEGLADVVDPNPSHRNPIYVDDGFPFISTVEFSGTDDLIMDTSRRVAEATVIEQEQRCKFRPDSIAFSRKGTIGAARILPHSMRFALLDSVCVINCGQKVNHMFLYRQISSAVFTTQLGKLTRGAALKQVSVGRVRRLRVLVPPIHEQEAIVTYLEEQLPSLNSLVKAMKNSVKLLREYRTRLIADVVTGKLDVREAAANLLDEVEEAEVQEDAEEYTEEETVIEGMEEVTIENDD